MFRALPTVAPGPIVAHSICLIVAGRYTGGRYTEGRYNACIPRRQARTYFGVTGVPREHEDIDVAFFRADLPVILDRLSPGLCVWSNLSGTLRPLRKPDDLLDGARQLWVRRDGDSPWVMDLAMTPHEGETWISPRDDRVRLPLADATFVAPDGIRYLRPELVLFMKALLARPKDDTDLAATLPLIDQPAREQLRAWLELVHPGHRWLEAIVGPAQGSG